MVAWFSKAKLDIKDFESILIAEKLDDLKTIRKLSDDAVMYVEPAFFNFQVVKC